VTDDARAVTAVVLGGAVTGLAVLRELGRAGVPVLATADGDDVAAASKYFRPLPAAVPAEDEDGTEAYFRSLELERAVLFPCSDSWARAASGFPSELQQRFPSVSAPARLVEQFADKAAFLDLVQRSSVPHPRTVVVADVRDLATIPDSELTGYFLKPCDSQAFSGRFGLKGFPIADRRHAHMSIERATREGLSLLAQEVIPGPATSHIFLDGYVARDGTLAALLARRRLRMFPRDFGNSTMTVSIALSDAEGAVDSLRRLFEDVGYTGLFDAEYKFDERDGFYKLLEVNTRAWWQIGLWPSCGVAVCLLAYRDALGQAVEPVTTYEVGRRWVHEFRDLPAWLGERGRRLTPLVSWRDCEYAIFSRDDTKPFVLAGRHHARSVLSRARRWRPIHA
jgi:predicted ATP-grasp superfamily ATP-dependent carboligase